jgi:hypothetical protein
VENFSNDGPRTTVRQPCNVTACQVVVLGRCGTWSIIFAEILFDFRVLARRSIMDAVSSQVTAWPSDVRSLLVRAHNLTHMYSRKAGNSAVMSTPHISSIAY